MKKAIVTGATGAVGTALVNKLISKGVETLVLVRKGGRVNKIPSNPLVKIAYCSLDEMADFQNENDEKYDAFFHLAWAGPYGKDRNDMFLQTDNIKNELEAVKLAKRFGVVFLPLINFLLSCFLLRNSHHNLLWIWN